MIREILKFVSSSYRTLNIEKNQGIIDLINNWSIYYVERKGKSSKQIRRIANISEISGLENMRMLCHWLVDMTFS